MRTLYLSWPRQWSIALLFFAIFTCLDSFGQTQTPEPAGEHLMDWNITLQHTTLVVSDFEVSSKFYKGLLGLKEIPAPWLPDNQMFLALGDRLELHVGEVQGVDIRPSDFNHFAFSVNDLPAFLEYLKENGVVYSSLGGAQKYHVQLRADGVSQTFFQDPDGYWIEVNDFQTAKRK